jgi:hypothetical protein
MCCQPGEYKCLGKLVNLPASPFTGGYEPVLTHAHYGRAQEAQGSIRVAKPLGFLRLAQTVRGSTEVVVRQSIAGVNSWRWGAPVKVRRCSPNTRSMTGAGWGVQAPMITKVNSKPPVELPRYSYASVDSADLLAKAQRRALKALYGR